MIKRFLILACFAPLSLFAQHLKLNDLFYLYEHSKSECDSYLASRDFISVSMPDSKDEKGCNLYAWMYEDANLPFEGISKSCSDGMKGNVIYSTLSRKVYDDLLQEYEDHGFTFLKNIKNDKGTNFDFYKWFNCIGSFWIIDSDQGPVYSIGLEHIRDKE